MAEGVLVGMNTAFGSIGPCGPGNVFTVLFMLWHLPGMLLSSPIWALSNPEHEPNVCTVVGTGIEFFVGGLMFTGLFYLVIKSRRGSNSKNASA